MTMPALLLQKPSQRSKAKEHATHLERHLKLWAKGRMNDLIHEGRTIQKQITRNQRSQLQNDDKNARLFAKFMMKGIVRACHTSKQQWPAISKQSS